MIFTKNRDVVAWPNSMQAQGIHLELGDLLIISKITHIQQPQSANNHSKRAIEDEYQKNYFSYFVFSFQRTTHYGWNGPNDTRNKICVLCMHDLKIRELNFFDSDLRGSKLFIIRK
jgi:hypothetical protein